MSTRHALMILSQICRTLSQYGLILSTQYLKYHLVPSLTSNVATITVICTLCHVRIVHLTHAQVNASYFT